MQVSLCGVSLFLNHREFFWPVNFRNLPAKIISGSSFRMARAVGGDRAQKGLAIFDDYEAREGWSPLGAGVSF
jgi:hypothetical protein